MNEAKDETVDIPDLMPVSKSNSEILDSIFEESDETDEPYSYTDDRVECLNTVIEALNVMIGSEIQYFRHQIHDITEQRKVTPSEIPLLLTLNIHGLTQLLQMIQTCETRRADLMVKV